MNRALVIALLRQRLTSPMRLMLLAFAFGPVAVMSVFSGSLQFVHGIAFQFALILAAGAIGQDVSSGVLQLTFARPVSRPSYVLSRWFAAGAGATLLGAAQLLAVAAVLAARGMPLPPAEVLVALTEGALLAFGGAAVLMSFSSFVNGLGDLGVYAMLYVTLGITTQVATLKHWTLVQRASTELSHMLAPELHLGWLAGTGAPAWTELVTLASTTALCLAVAIVVLNRKELSYAAD